jgi:hypothetical protein
MNQIAAHHQRSYDSINRRLRETGSLVDLLDPQTLWLAP